MTLKEQLKQYIPYNEQEEKDRDLIVEHLENSKVFFMVK